MVQVSNHYLENYRRSCREANSIIVMGRWTHKQTDGHMDVLNTKEGKLYALLDFMAGPSCKLQIKYLETVKQELRQAGHYTPVASKKM